ncbi:NAD(P)H-dependent flavin oxidoreductase [Cupriavidus oxalaticus]|uniref:Nitronate monooxygenase n=1 Tax=Cupriavidus oxalaticus TaxID=96344 RepID=A0A5P3VJH2_9BURK|nr:nitronate monooxygenase family protein [Cupriavidus oxalaticus]QEZ46574.1 nitronate monooxygenase [Cupriavidus oxalaticus]
MKTKITELFGIRYPIIQGGMQWVGVSQLVAAVSNAGGLGTLTALTQPSAVDLDREIKKTKALTSAPFAVNLTFLPTQAPPPYQSYIDAIIANGVKIVETAGNNPKEYLEILKDAGIKVIHKCTSVRHALSVQRMGVDAVSIDGFECAGHPGEDDVPGLVLIPVAVKALDIPVVASGGIATGEGMAAALALGADGVNMGTRFLTTVESPVHDDVKRAIVAARETDTQLVLRSFRNTVRSLRTPVTQQVVELEGRAEGCTFDDVRHLVTGRRGKAALASGDYNDSVLSAGQCIGLIDDVPACDELIQRMVRDCEAAFRKGASLFAHTSQ